MRVQLLGPVQAVEGGTGVNLGRPAERFVVAVLALEVNRVVTVDRLVELTWGASPPRTACHAVRVAVSRLRRVLAAATRPGPVRDGRIGLATRGSGYVLEADPDLIDAHRFRTLARRAALVADEPRIALLSEALGLWKGPALVGVGRAAAADVLGRGLEEARLAALEDRLEACLRTGRHREVLGELTDLAGAHPDRERPAALLMLALYRSGRAGAALDAYHRTRRHLEAEFGLSPSAELRELELAVLRDEAGRLDGAAPTQPQSQTQPQPQPQPGLADFGGLETVPPRPDAHAAPGGVGARSAAVTPAEAGVLLRRSLGGRASDLRDEEVAKLARLCGHRPDRLEAMAANLLRRPEADLGAYVADLVCWFTPGPASGHPPARIPVLAERR